MWTESRIERVIVRTPTVAGAAARVRQALVDETHPPNLPDGALLVVRALGVESAAGRVPLRDALTALVDRAARPDDPEVLTAQAVLFGDEVDLVVTLAVDAAAGRWPWWWGVLRRSPATVGAVLAEHAHLVPEIARRLAERGALGTVFAALDRTAARGVLQVVAEVHGMITLRGLMEGLQSPIPGVERLPPPHWESVRHTLGEGPRPPEALALGAVVLGLARAPVSARGPNFAMEILRFLALAERETEEYAARENAAGENASGDHTAGARPGGANPAGRSPAGEGPAGRGAAGGESAGGRTAGEDQLKGQHETQTGSRRGRIGDAHGAPASPASAGVDLPGSAPPTSISPTSAAGSTSDEGCIGEARTAPTSPGSAEYGLAKRQTTSQLPGRAPPVGAASHAATGDRREDAGGETADEPPPIGVVPTLLSEVSPRETDDAAPWNPWAEEADEALDRDTAPFRTAYGGVFYLVNVALALGWYPDFTRPREAGLDVPLPALLLTVGPRFVPNADPDDPIWAWLRRKIENVETVDPHRDPHRDPQHDPQRDPHRSAAENPELPPGSVMGLAPERVARLVAELRARLAEGIDLDPADLCAQPAEVHPNPPRVEVRFVLEQHPIEIRLSGLDRDPGWLPATGWDLRFRYELAGVRR